MGIVSVALAGQHGIAKDLAPAELPANAWSDGLNVRFNAGEVEAMRGDVELATTAGQPRWALPTFNALLEIATWVIPVDSKVYALQGRTLTDISLTGAPTVPITEPEGWTGGVLGTYVVTHDNKRAPWGWTSPVVGTPMVLLPNWPAGMLAYTLRSFKQYLIALGVTKGGTFYPTMVKWSHPADPGFAPPSWDETDPTKDAGETVLAETPGQCMDCVSLRDVNIIYKRDSVWGMQYIGGVFVFRFYKIFGDFGIPNRNCAVEYISGKHFVFTGTDLIVHDGNSAQSVVTGKMRKFMRDITTEQISTCYVCTNPAMDEAWLCWNNQSSGEPWATVALVYNYKENTLALRELGNYRFIQSGRVDPVAVNGDAWSARSESWDDSGVAWLEYDQIPEYQRLLAVGDGKITWVDGQASPLGTGFLERTYIGIPTRADKAPDLSAMKFVRRVWPRLTGEPGMRLLVTFGSADSVAEDIRWRAPLEFIIGTTRKFDITLSGKVMAVRIECPATTPPAVGLWKFNGMDIDVKATGEM